MGTLGPGGPGWQGGALASVLQRLGGERARFDRGRASALLMARVHRPIFLDKKPHKKAVVYDNLGETPGVELKRYQTSVLDRFGRWLDELEAARRKSETAIAALGDDATGTMADEIRNYPKLAWKELARAGEVAAAAGEYVTRTDGAGRSIPHVCLKVPTGGGKTLLAASALERLNRQTGLTLWITPTRAIYRQTKEALWDRRHPYRQMLERASGGRVKVLEKDQALDQGDVANYLCVMLLMLPAANRKKGREFLRIFRDSGRYPTLFPDGDDLGSDARLLEAHPDLDQSSEGWSSTACSTPSSCCGPSSCWTKPTRPTAPRREKRTPNSWLR